jgi:hypothetical protein
MLTPKWAVLSLVGFYDSLAYPFPEGEPPTRPPQRILLAANQTLIAVRRREIVSSPAASSPRSSPAPGGCHGAALRVQEGRPRRSPAGSGAPTTPAW